MKLSTLLPTAIMLLLSSPAIKGTDYQSGERITIDQPVAGDLYIGTGELLVQAPVYGDLIAAGGKIRLMDSVSQDVLVAGGEIYLYGNIGDDLRAAGGRIIISGLVAGDLLVFGGEVTVEESAQIKGDLSVFGGDISIQGIVDGSVKVAGGSIYFSGTANSAVEIKGGEMDINGHVKGPATLAASKIELGDHAKFDNSVRYWQDNGQLDFGDVDARFDPELENYQGDRKPFGISWVPFLVLYAFSILLILILLNFLFDNALAKAAHTLQQDSTRSLAYGAIYMLGLPVLGILLLVTIIGIPIGLLLLALGFFSWIFGLSITSVITAKSLKTRYNYQTWNTWMLVLVSAAVFIVFKLISLIPILGWLAYLLLVAMAFGSILVNIFGKRESPPSTA